MATNRTLLVVGTGELFNRKEEGFGWDWAATDRLQVLLKLEYEFLTREELHLVMIARTSKILMTQIACF